MRRASVRGCYSYSITTPALQANKALMDTRDRKRTGIFNQKLCGGAREVAYLSRLLPLLSVEALATPPSCPVCVALIRLAVRDPGWCRRCVTWVSFPRTKRRMESTTGRRATSTLMRRFVTATQHKHAMLACPLAPLNVPCMLMMKLRCTGKRSSP